jgi:hypothetical protein
MKGPMIPKDYANTLIYEIQKAFWDERGKGARFRMTKVGNAFFLENCLPLIQTENIDQIIQTISQVLKEKGIVGSVSYELEDRLIRVTIQGCIHLDVEKRMIAKGVEPFTCIPANLIVLAIEEKLNRPVELAEIKVENGVCRLMLVMFDKRPSLD